MIKEQVVTKYTADTAQAQAAIRKLADEQRALAKSGEGAAAAGSKFLGALDKLSTIAAPVAAVAALTKGFRELAEYQTLQARASTYAVEKIVNGTKGLVTEMDAMRMAAKLAGKVTTDQMEMAAKAAFALSNEGFDLRESFEKLTASLIKGKAEGLGDLGLKFREVKGEGEKFGAMMETIAAKAKEGETATIGEAGAIQKLGVDMQNSMDKVKRSLGEIVIAMEPLVSLIADLVGLVADLASKAASLFRGSWKDYSQSQREAAARAGYNGADNDDVARFQANEAYQIAAGLGGLPVSDDYGAGGRTTTARETVDPRITAAIAARKNRPRTARRSYGELAEVDFTPFMLPSTGKMVYGQELDPLANFDNLAASEFMNAIMDTGEAGPSFLERHLGTLEEFDGYTTAFQTLQGAVTSALTAWIDGSMSAGAAVKAFFSDALKGLAVESATRALYHGAGAIASLAVGDGRGAAMHGKAAAGYAAAAAAATVGARALGRGFGGAQAAGGSAGGGASGSLGGGGGQGQAVTVISYGDSFSDDSHRMRQHRARRLVALAQGGDHRGGVRYE